MIKNVHFRVLDDTPPDQVGGLLERIADPDASLWSAGHWPALILDQGLEPGSGGGHGPVRYHVIDHCPGRRVQFRFDSIGLDATHALEVLEARTADSTLLRHTLIGRAPRRGDRLVWWLIYRPLHDAMLEDVLDRICAEAGRPPVRRARWSWWVRAVRRVLAVDRRLRAENSASQSSFSP